MTYNNIDKDSDDTILEHLILEKTGVLKGHHLLPKKKTKSKSDKSKAWIYLMVFYMIVIPIIYVQHNRVEGYSVSLNTVGVKTKIMYINEFPNASLYGYCKAKGIKESDILKLNPWINKEASNIPANAEILVPTSS